MAVYTPIKTIRATKATISYDGEGIIINELDEDIEVTVEDVMEHRQIMNELTKGANHVVLAMAGKHTTATKEAREYSSQNKPKGRLAEAVVITSMPVRLMGKVFISFHKPAVETRLFESREAALIWLRSVLNG